MPVSMSHSVFGHTAAGEPVQKFVLANDHGLQLTVISFGAAVQSLLVPDSKGTVADVVHGYDDVAGYEKNSSFQGVIVGRYANRIAQGRFTLDGVSYQLATNNGPNHLHGGPAGFHKKNWTCSASGCSVTFECVSADLEEGYPGELRVRVTYTLTEDSKVVIDYHATTDRPTIVNLTNHSYFNLAGVGAGTILEHVIEAPITHYTPVDSALIPTGEIALVEGTAFDFRAAATIGSRIGQIDNGYDHNLVIHRPAASPALALALKATEPASGRVLELHTTEPGVQFYTGGFLDGFAGKGGVPVSRFHGFCIETQRFPDTPNQPLFPSAELRPGQVYESQTVFSFSTVAS